MHGEFGMEVLSFAEKNVPVVCSEGNQFVETFAGTSLAPSIVNIYNIFTAFTDRNALNLTYK